MHITLDGLHFYGTDGDVRFTINRGSLRGWFESPGVRRENTPRPLGDGSFTARTYRSGRTVAWSGLIYTDSPSEQRVALEQLAGVCEGRDLARLTVQHESASTWADVQLNQAPEAEVLVYGRIARYDVELWAPDARRYGELRTFAGADRVYHRGNAPAFPLVTIPDAASSYTLSSEGKAFQVSGAPAGGTHVIDLRTGRLRRNGVTLVGAVTRADPWVLPPGMGQTFALSPSKSFTVQVRDTFF